MDTKKGESTGLAPEGGLHLRWDRAGGPRGEWTPGGAAEGQGEWLRLAAEQRPGGRAHGTW